MAKVLIGNVKGPQGDAATVSVGTVSTGAAGSSAAVTNSGTSSEAVFNFTIPKGDAGSPGVTDFATASAAGLVRIGSDFNINSENGVISENNTFSMAGSLAEINSGDAHATILGKLKKFMNTLMPSTFVRDGLAYTDTDKALSANQGKVLNTRINKHVSDFANNQQSTMTAAKAYKAGEYFVHDDELYRVTAAVASGGTFVPNTNCAVVNFGQEIYSKLTRGLIGTLSAEANVTIGSGASIVLVGSLVVLSMSITTSAAFSTNSTLVTVSSNCTPDASWYLNARSGDTTYGIYVDKYGNIKCSGAWPAGSYAITGVYGLNTNIS